jgi:hypothetical protein
MAARGLPRIKADSAGSIGPATHPPISTAAKYRNTTTATCHPAGLGAALSCSATNMVATAGSSGRRVDGTVAVAVALTAGLTSMRSRRAFGAHGLRAALARRPHPS